MNRHTSALATTTYVAGADPRHWITDGRRMAIKEGGGVFKSLEHTHAAEFSTFGATIAALKAQGSKLLEEYRRLEARLSALDFDPARHLREVARGRVDLYWAVGLTILNAVLAVLVLTFSSGSSWMTMFLAFLVLATAVPVEEFFMAVHEKNTLREGLFLVLALLALAASFWLGSLRGLFIVAQNPLEAGPATDALRVAGAILRYALGVLALASETLAGFKWYCVRHRLYSTTARAAKKRSEIASELVTLQASIKAAEAEPDIRREYRTVGARQHLAEAARGEADHAHLRRALIGASIALLVLIGLFYFTSKASAEPIRGISVTRVVLLDLTKSSTAEAFQANVKAVEQVVNALPNHGRIVVIGISDSFGRPRILLDRTVSSRGSFGLELQAAREAATANWRKVAANLTPQYEHTNLLGTLDLLPYLMTDSNYELLIFSDARENVFINIANVTQVNVPRVMKDLQRKKAIPSLSNVHVYMLGVVPDDKTALYFRSLKEFWSAYFQAAGARLEAFRVDRTLTSMAAQ